MPDTTSSSTRAWLNGVAFDIRQPIFRADSQAFLRGDALWEVLRIENGKMIGWNLHFDRIRRGLSDARLTDRDLGEEILAGTAAARAAAASYACGKLYLAVLPNGDGFDVLATTENYSPPSDERYTAGFRAVISELPHPMLGAYGKSTSYQWSRIAQRRAEARGGDMAILLNGDEIVEATTAAVIWYRDERWWTVRDNNGALPSTTVHSLERLGMTFTRVRAKVLDLKRADSVVLVSALRLAVGLTSLDEHIYAAPDEAAAPLRVMLLGSAGK